MRLTLVPLCRPDIDGTKHHPLAENLTTWAGQESCQNIRDQEYWQGSVLCRSLSCCSSSSSSTRGGCGVPTLLKDQPKDEMLLAQEPWPLNGASMANLHLTYSSSCLLESSRMLSIKERRDTSSLARKTLEISLLPALEPPRFKQLPLTPRDLMNEHKPLPPVPRCPSPLKSATLSTFTREVSDAFRTPLPSMDAHHPALHGWPEDAAQIATLLEDEPVYLPERTETTRAYPPPTPPGDATPPSNDAMDSPADGSPRSKRSVTSFLRRKPMFQRDRSDSALSTSPLDRNLPKKIRQMMGIEGSPEPDEYQWTPPSPISPATPSSSRYSDDLVAQNTPEPEKATATGGWGQKPAQREKTGYASDPESDSSRQPSWASQPGFVPKSLSIHKERRPSTATPTIPAVPTISLSRVDSVVTMATPPPTAAPMTMAPTVPLPALRHNKSWSDGTQPLQDDYTPAWKRQHSPNLSSSALDYHISTAEIASSSRSSVMRPHRAHPSAKSVRRCTSQASQDSIATVSTQILADPSDLQTEISPKHIILERFPSPPQVSKKPSLTPVAEAPLPGAPAMLVNKPKKIPIEFPKSVFDESDSESEDYRRHRRWGSGGNGSTTRMSVVARVFSRRHGGGTSGTSTSGSGNASGSSSATSSTAGSRPTSRESLFNGRDARPPVNVTSAPRPASRSPSGERPAIGSKSPRLPEKLDAQEPGTPPATVYIPQKKGLAKARSKAELRQGIKGQLRIFPTIRPGPQTWPRPPPPKPPRPLSLAKVGLADSKLEGNWL